MKLTIGPPTVSLASTAICNGYVNRKLTSTPGPCHMIIITGVRV